jgi:hypothetical protein
MALALVYDPRYHTFESWAALMCEAYAGQQLEIPNSSTDWQKWAAGLKGIGLFASEEIPGPYLFNDWQEWAQAMVNAVNQPVAQTNANANGNATA